MPKKRHWTRTQRASNPIEGSEPSASAQAGAPTCFCPSYYYLVPPPDHVLFPDSSSGLYVRMARPVKLARQYTTSIVTHLQSLCTQSTKKLCCVILFARILVFHSVCMAWAITVIFSCLSAYHCCFLELSYTNVVQQLVFLVLPLYECCTSSICTNNVFIPHVCLLSS